MFFIQSKPFVNHYIQTQQPYLDVFFESLIADFNAASIIAIQKQPNSLIIPIAVSGFCRKKDQSIHASNLP